jgi:DNA-binding beta-propeller fold protein YncE
MKPMRWLLAALCLPACESLPGDAEATCAEPGTICTIAGVPERLGFNGDGLLATATELYLPTAIAWGPDGRLLINDYNNFRVRVVEPSAEGATISTLVGDGVHAWATAGLQARETSLENVMDLSVTRDGHLVLSEYHTDRVLDVRAGIVGVMAGGGAVGIAGDGGPALQASFLQPAGVAAAPDGRVFVSDSGHHAIRALLPDGTVQLVLGDYVSGFRDGVGAPRLNRPQRVRLDGDRLLIADSLNHVVRAVDIVTGAATILAGTGEAGSDGDGGPATAARLQQPYSAVGGPDGEVYIADMIANVVRRVDPDGTIHTVAGTGAEAFAGDQGPATEAALHGPNDVLVGPDGALYIVELFNSVVRRVAP